MSIQAELEALRREVKDILKSLDRAEDSAHIIAVSKTRPASAVLEAMQTGQLDFGENRVQEMTEKMPLAPGAHWHLIGHLQTNKVKYIAPFVHLIHSVDSDKLLEEINRQGLKHQRIIPCLLQVNISDEAQKSGMDETEAEALLARISQFPAVKIMGLMGMAEMTEDRERIRSQFRRLRTAAEGFRKFEGPQVEMKELSMGMSDDFPIALAEGATLIRVGSRIFGSR